ncbi:MAG: ABC-F family ATP-binding cassette domain-containing protein [Planctomycetota bacterium]
MTTLLLSCENLSRGFDADPLFEDLSFEIFSGQSIGLVGPNGAGKTTLMMLLAGLDQPDTGSVRHHAGARVGLLRQKAEYGAGRSLFEEAKTALDEIIAAHDDMIRTAEFLAQATDETQRKSLAARYDRLQEILHAQEAFNVDHRIEEVLQGLGFVPDDYGRAVDTFSGGQQSRLMLAKILLASPDVLLLDEPSNHLDIQTTRWLEDYLIKQSEGMLIVSHDRYFLNRVVNKIYELNDRQVEAYVGNYDAYVRQRGERYEQRLKAWEAQRESIEKQEEYIRRVGYSQRAAQAQSRQKALDKVERLERPTMIDTPHLHFGAVRRSGDVVIDTQDLTKRYDRPLFSDLSFQLKRGQRLGIMGPNGCGKTTLLKILLGMEEPDSGEARVGHLVKFGYYDQHLKTLPDDKTVIRAVWPVEDKDATEQTMRNLLGRFGLVGDQVNQIVGQLSGGERSRAALARLVALGVNVLILDEPTNHLDLWACDALEQALLDFDGTVICVSHDRYFLNRVVDLLLVFEGEGRVEVIYGNYDTYERMRLLKLEDAGRGKKKEPKTLEIEARPATNAKVKRKRKFTYRKVPDLEADIAAEEVRLRELEASLASSELYREGGKVKETTEAFEATKIRLAQLYEHWEEAVELN